MQCRTKLWIWLGQIIKILHFVRRKSTFQAPVTLTNLCDVWDKLYESMQELKIIFKSIQCSYPLGLLLSWSQRTHACPMEELSWNVALVHWKVKILLSLSCEERLWPEGSRGSWLLPLSSARANRFCFTERVNFLSPETGLDSWRTAFAQWPTAVLLRQWVSRCFQFVGIICIWASKYELWENIL